MIGKKRTSSLIFLGREEMVELLDGPHGLRAVGIGTGLSYKKSLSDSRVEELLRYLVKKGDSHAAGMRMIWVWLRVRNPRYWWQEYDKYKFSKQLEIDLEERSESTVHTILRKELTQEDFEEGVSISIIETLNALLNAYKNGIMSKSHVLEMVKGNLPEGYLQTRIVNVNYQTLRHIYFDRRDHSLSQWHEFCEFIEELPYSELITIGG